MGNVGWGHEPMHRAKRMLRAMVTTLLVGNVAALAVHDDGSATPASPSAAGAVDTLPELGDVAEEGAGPATPTTTATRKPTTTTTKPQSKAASGSGSTTTSTPVPTFTTLPPYTFDVKLAPTCARVGEDFTVTFKVEPYTGVGIVATHADGSHHDTMWGTTAPADGTVVHTWKAPAAPGDGLALAGATTPDGRSGGTQLPFRIVGATESC